MGVVRGNMEATITLSRSTCYFMKTGKCSLTIIGDHYLSPGGRIAANDLLYCPRLYQAMRTREQDKPITILPCSCGHAEVVSGHQRACIAGRTKLPLMVQAVSDREVRPFCSLCDGQVTFESQDNGGIRIVTVRAIIETGEDAPPQDTEPSQEAAAAEGDAREHKKQNER